MIDCRDDENLKLTALGQDLRCFVNDISYHPFQIFILCPFVNFVILECIWTIDKRDEKETIIPIVPWLFGSDHCPGWGQKLPPKYLQNHN